MTKLVRVGVMPGRIEEVAVEVGTKVEDVLNIAGLNASGYDVKIDGVTSSTEDTVGEGTNLILLVKQVKGNSTVMVRVGMMPGRIEEYAVESGSKVSDLIQQANLDPTGYDIKVDGVTLSDEALINEDTSLVLLVKQVKGNSVSTVRVGVMPGRIEEHAVESGVTISELIEQAGLDSSGYDVKVDGVTVTPSEAHVTPDTNLVLLVKQVKGNK